MHLYLSLISMFIFSTSQRLTVLVLLFIWHYLDWTRPLCFGVLFSLSDSFKIFFQINLLYKGLFKRKPKRRKSLIIKKKRCYDSNTPSAEVHCPQSSAYHTERPWHILIIVKKFNSLTAIKKVLSFFYENHEFLPIMGLDFTLINQY